MRVTLSIILVLLCIAGKSQSLEKVVSTRYNFTGMVYDYEEKTFLVGASVKLLRGEEEALAELVTNKKGKFVFKMPLGTYKIVVSAEGFSPFTGVIRVGNGSGNHENIYLNKLKGVKLVPVEQ